MEPIRKHLVKMYKQCRISYFLLLEKYISDGDNNNRPNVLRRIYISPTWHLFRQSSRWKSCWLPTW